MKNLLWIGLLFVSFSWIFFLPIFVTPDVTTGLIILIIGLIFNVFAFWKNETFKINKYYSIFLIPLIITMFFITFPSNIGVIVLIISTITYFILVNIFKITKLGWVSIGLGFSGLMLIVEATFLPFLYVFTAQNHRVDFLSPIVSFFARIFGLESFENNGMLFVQTTGNNFPITTTLEKLGFFPWFLILLGTLCIFFFSPKIKNAVKKLLLFLILSFIYIILRYICLIIIFTTIKYDDLSIFYDPFITFISFIPLIFLLSYLIPLKNLSIDLNCFINFKIIHRKNIVALLLIFIFVFSLVGAYAYYDPGVKKSGRILVDEFHSYWENSNEKMDKEWYGKLSTYNSYSLFEWLNYTYYVDRNIDSIITSDILKNYDILVVKCPTNSYSNEEINNIVKFVEDGGGLYLVGDHTNVFGMNFYLNQISERFGIIFKYDSTHDLTTGELSIYKTPELFPHPIVQYIPEFNYLSSCTLKVPLNSENVMIGQGLTSIMGTYSTENFFRTSGFKEPDVEQGLFVQTTALKFGKGRVVAFSDSTCISNFCVFMENYPPFYLMTMEYLNRSNLYSYVNTLFIAMSILSFGIIIYLLRKEKKTITVFMFVLIGLLSFSIATPFFSNLNLENYSLPEPRNDFTSICFVKDYSNAVISSRTSVMDVNHNIIFNNFFIWTQRLDFVPSITKDIDAAIEKGDAIVIINPVKSFTNNDIIQIENYFKNGGNVLLLDSILNNKSTANELLKYFSMSIVKENESTLKIIGSNSTVFDEKYADYMSIAVTAIEKGKFVVVVDSQNFSDARMGGSFTEPNIRQREIYDAEFYIFEEIIFLKPSL
jgi:hypothetical protein